MSDPTNTDAQADKKFTTFAEFYPFYLSEHSHQTSRRLHFVGHEPQIAKYGSFLSCIL